MHIESITLEGFRSFAHRTTVSFDPRHTTLFGSNGSGKSTLLAAVAFVLQPCSSGKFLTVCSSLHQSKNQNVKVEIVMKDDDRRCSKERKLDEDGDKTISIRREVSRTKETFYLNDKAVSSRDVADFLASIGLIPSNPFHFVRQGEINRLATTSPAERLRLLENFSGMTVYKKNSGLVLAKLGIVDKKLKIVDNRIKDIRDEVDFQKKEAEELDKFLETEKVVKALQKVLLLSEKQNVITKLGNAEKGDLTELLDLRLEYDNGTRALKKANRMKKEFLEKEKILRDKREIFSCDFDVALKELESTKEEKQTLMSRIKELKEAQANATVELSDLKAKVCTVNECLKKVTAKADEQRQDAEKCQLKISKLSQCRDTIRGLRQNSTVNLDAEIEKIKSQIAAQTSKVANLKVKVNSVKLYKKEYEDSLGSTKVRVVQKENDVQMIKSQIGGLNRDIHAYKIRSGHLRRQLMSEQMALELKKTLCHKARNDLMKGYGMGKLKDGIQSLETILNHLKNNKIDTDLINGFHGYVADLFENEATFDISISTAIANKLFYAVVSDRNIAQRLLKWQKMLQLAGEINFMPIDLIERKGHINFNAPRATNFRRMVELVNFNEDKYGNVINNVFGREVVLESMDDFHYFKGLNQVNCVTLDGQRCTGHGVLTGGYYNQKDSKLTLYRKYQTQKNSLQNLREHVESSEASIMEVEAKLLKFLNNREENIANLDEKKSSILKLGCDIHTLQNYRNASEEEEKLSSSELFESSIELAKLEQILDILTSESHEQEDPKRINMEITELQLSYNKILKEVIRLETEENEYKNLLRFNLEPRVEELTKFISPMACKADLEALETCKDSFKILRHECERLECEKKECDDQLNRLIGNKISALTKTEDLEAKISQLKTDVEKLEREGERSCQFVANWNEQLKRVDEKIDLLGIVDSELMKECEHRSLDDCQKLLKKGQKKLKASGNVNKAAHKRSEFLTENLDKFMKRRQLYEVDRKCATDLLQIIKQTKREKLEWTRSRVGLYFQEILKELCPTAKGALSFEPKELVEDSLHSSSAESSTSKSSNECPEDPTSLKILVKFGSSSEFAELGSLSGGQKTCVALAFIFAVQKCDPAPFYILDEVDACLDTQTRHRLANWLLASRERVGLQYITTTFRKELAEVADKLLKVEFGSQSSRISEATKEEGIEFLTNNS